MFDVAVKHDEATSSLYGGNIPQSEQAMGFHSMLEEYLAVPFKSDVLGMKVTVEAPANIAFIKYWGARDLEAALPANPSDSSTPCSPPPARQAPL